MNLRDLTRHATDRDSIARMSPQVGGEKRMATPVWGRLAGLHASPRAMRCQDHGPKNLKIGLKNSRSYSAGEQGVMPCGLYSCILCRAGARHLAVVRQDLIVLVAREKSTERVPYSNYLAFLRLHLAKKCHLLFRGDGFLIFRTN